MNLGIDCGNGNVVYADMMGGYGAERDNVIYVHGVKENDNGKTIDDWDNRFEIAWEDRFDEDVLETVGDSCFIKVGIEKDTQDKYFIKKFLSAYDAIEYIQQHIENGMVLNVKGNLKYQLYNDNISVKKEINSIFLSKAKQEDYKGNSHRILCEDEYGYRGLTSYNHLNRIKSSGSTGIEYFSYKHNRENLFYNLNNYCKINNIASKPIKISEEQKYAKMAITFQCSCGNYFDTTINSFRTWKHKCDKCSGNVSSFELKTKEFLNKYKIEFTIEKRFNDCKNNLPLPFDFYIKSKNLIIEIDGQGHFRPTHFNSCSNEDAELSYKLTRINDKIKNKYCKDNNINLIRIPYWEFETEQYKTTLLENVVNN